MELPATTIAHHEITCLAIPLLFAITDITGIESCPNDAIRTPDDKKLYGLFPTIEQIVVCFTIIDLLKGDTDLTGNWSNLLLFMEESGKSRCRSQQKKGKEYTE